MHTPLDHLPAKPSMHSLPHIPKLHPHSKNTTPANKTSTNPNLLSIKKKKTPKINSSQSMQASKQATTRVPIANTPPPAAIACCGKLGFPFPPKPTEQEKQFQIPNSNKSGSM
jgi:hypothetical protein